MALIIFQYPLQDQCVHGGTESAVTMLIADHVRKAVGLSKFQANSFDDETGRFVEELRIYEREARSFQFHILDEDIEHVF